MSDIQCEYVGGPLDGETETREQSPRNGEEVYRLVDEQYHAYRWDGERSVFVYVGNQP